MAHILTDCEILSSEWWSGDVESSKYYNSFSEVIKDYSENSCVAKFSRLYFSSGSLLPLHLMTEEGFISKWMNYGMNWWEVEQHEVTAVK